MGYDVEERELVINGRDADTVRHIFGRYIELGSVSLLKDDLDRDGITSPVRIAASTGNRSGDRPLARGALYKMLSNRIYLGEITHNEDSYPGNHKAILEPELWERVQEKLQSNSVNRRNRTNAKRPSLLAGLLFDGKGNRFTPTHANKNGKHYRYYTSPSQSLPAGDIEGVVISRLQALLGNGTELLHIIESATDDIGEQKALLDSDKQLAGRWSDLQPSEVKAIITGSIPRVEVQENRIDIHIDPHGLHHVLRESINNIPPATNSDDLIILSVEAELKRCGMEMKMVVTDGTAVTQTGPDHTLVTTIIKAHSWWNKLTSGEVKSIRELTEQTASNERYVAWTLRLVHLSPAIIEACLTGNQPAELTPKH